MSWRSKVDQHIKITRGLPLPALWCDLPEHYGKWKTVYRRLSRCNRLKHFLRFVRYERRTTHFAGFAHLATTMIWPR